VTGGVLNGVSFKGVDKGVDTMISWDGSFVLGLIVSGSEQRMSERCATILAGFLFLFAGSGLKKTGANRVSGVV
jgi:hypothetical protein